jgi:hypothetical protein
MKHAATIGLVTLSALAAAGLGGCRTRTLEITSDPPGALVWLNDEQVGRTPLETGFVHYGAYDVRLRLEGYNPIVTHRTAGAPLVDQPGPDFVSQAFPGDSRTVWHFKLDPLPELTDQRGAEDAAFERAKAFRDKMGGAKAAAPSEKAQPKGDAGTPTTVAPSATSPSTTAPAPTTAK